MRTFFRKWELPFDLVIFRLFPTFQACIHHSIQYRFFFFGAMWAGQVGPFQVAWRNQIRWDTARCSLSRGDEIAVASGWVHRVAELQRCRIACRVAWSVCNCEPCRLSTSVTKSCTGSVLAKISGYGMMAVTATREYPLIWYNMWAIQSGSANL